eukprot:2835417-Amphidinium_carterae.1
MSPALVLATAWILLSPEDLQLSHFLTFSAKSCPKEYWLLFPPVSSIGGWGVGTIAPNPDSKKK